MSSLPKPARIFLIVLGAIFALLLLIVLGLNIYMRTNFALFYGMAEEEFPIPGTADGFVVQDLDFLDEDESWLFSGYSGDGSASPVYKRGLDGTVSRFYVELSDGSLYDGHGSGITSQGDFVFLTCEGGYLILPAQDVAQAADGERVPVLGRKDLDFSPAFLNIEEGTLYAGNFYYPEKYETPAEHWITTPDGTENPAVMYAYPAGEGEYGFSDKAQCVFSIPAMVQGMCFTATGNMVLSTSWGIGASHFYEYDLASTKTDGVFTADDREVPLICLDSRNLVGELEAPPMSEGIESHEGRIYMTDEAASNTYLFGKIYGFDDVYSFVMDTYSTRLTPSTERR